MIWTLRIRLLLGEKIKGGSLREGGQIIGPWSEAGGFIKIGVLLRTSFKNGDTSEYSTIGYHPFRRDEKPNFDFVKSVLKIATIPLGSTPITNYRVFFGFE